MMSKRQAEFRAEYRPRISPWYSGVLHVLVIYAIGFAALAYCIPRIHQPSPAEWLVVPVVFLARQLAHPVDYLIETLHAPAPLGGVIMAVLVATPEAIGAVRAAMANQLQRSINIFLGSVLSTIGLTIPAMVLISHLVGEDFLLGLEHTDMVMLSLTLLVSVITFASGHTNVMQGAVHLILFATYLLLIVNP